MTTYIFQANPDRYDIDGALASGRERITWLVTRYKNDIRLGDQVFIWRAKGSGAYGPSGIVAECVVDSPISKSPEDPAELRFYRKPPDSKLRDRVSLKVVRVAKKYPVLDGNVIKGLSVLERVGPLGLHHATNFEVDSAQSTELNKLWSSVI